MATLTYSISGVGAGPCAGGGHVTIDITLNALPSKRVVYTTDEIRASLALLTPEEQAFATLVIAKLHFAGMSRAQMLAEMPLTVVI